jgi:hypothetical protein
LNKKDYCLKFIFIDAENIGLKEVEAVTAEITDKVLVFSKNDSIKEICERKLFICNSNYPTGSNQADFYIIGKLVGMFASLTEQQRGSCHFVLYSQDNALVTAFSFQCKLHKVKHNIALVSKTQAQPITPVAEPKNNKSLQSLEQKIYDHFKTEQTTENVRKKLNQSKPDFTKALNALIKAKKIQRVSKNKKTWMRTK